jgi:hypothetical protein
MSAAVEAQRAADRSGLRQARHRMVSNLGPSSIRHKVGAGDVATFIRSQEGGSGGEFVRAAKSTKSKFSHKASNAIACAVAQSRTIYLRAYGKRFASRRWKSVAFRRSSDLSCRPSRRSMQARQIIACRCCLGTNWRHRRLRRKYQSSRLSNVFLPQSRQSHLSSLFMLA